MTANDTARRNHDELFPNHRSTLSQTDPELIAYFDDFAFDEVLRHGDLPRSTRLMTQLAALIGMGALGEFRVMLSAALTAGVTPVQVKEIVYQAVPYAGMGRVVDFVHAVNEELVRRGVPLPLPSQSTTTPQTRLEQGRRVQGEIIGAEVLESLYAGSPADELHIQRFLSGNCFGDHYTRTGLDIPTRELLTLSILVAQGGCEPQVRGHVRANLNVGNGRETLIDVVTQLLPYIGYPRTLNALRAIDDIVPPEPQGETSDMARNEDVKDGVVFPAGEPNDRFARYFTGASYLQTLVGDPRFDVSVGNVTFEPGCRNNWHIHHDGYQLLLVTGGEGWFQEAGESARPLRPGDVVEIADGVKHWHGAAKDSWFSHIAITKGTSEWLEPVSDEEYAALG
ncbi:hypothetical protein GCM10009785_14920 [Brooklawnia cerclae]|uniref:Alkylhydroperoxidase/carboxymuconolactone decarboxylase family protein YurZ/quercetin dioxygenase-like cupin family protein n=1 Tax=Brooklawnia cerclae TaxID=349934 RepID=A0ABX0SMH1_9ACTN|nr:carboxymuconolactone decarboxylase family protein [Brooklawnia cerclae]NIH57937.1 alkylhydroperoxidase/carboxymuconolactone decarboxylase family protein YurZ/quercetin dioxygenase-like cupin family protein [Brooklawnia cerclae]